MAGVLGVIVKVVIYLIPIIGSLIGGPLGWLAGWGLQFLLGFLQRALKIAEIDQQTKVAIAEFRDALERVKKDEKDAQALENFRVAASRLSNIRL